MPKTRRSCRFPAARPVRPAHANSSETKKIICPMHAAHVGHMIGDWFNLSPLPADSFHRLRTPSTACGRSPSLEEGGLGGIRVRSKLFIQLRVQGRNPARFKGGYGVPRGFKGGSKPSAPCGRFSEAEHPKRKGATLLRPLSAVNRNRPGNSHSRASAPCDFRFPPCFFPHSGRMAPIPLIP